MPPVRQAAWRWKVSPGTVSRVYNALRAQNLIHAKVGRGTFVGAGKAEPSYLNSDLADVDELDLSRNAVLAPSPRPLLEAAHQSVYPHLAQGGLPLTCIGEMGWPQHRDAAMAHLRRWRDIESVDEIALTNGAQSALTACIMALVPPGGAIGVERQAYFGIVMAARLAGRRVYPLDTDDAGMVPEHLDQACRKHGVRAIFVMPSLQNPTGRVMPQARREDLLEMVQRHDLTLLEDEVYGFLRPSKDVSFSRLDPERTVLITGLSKCVAPILRVGYVAASLGKTRRIAAAHNGLQLMVSPLMSAMAAHILESPAFQARMDAIQPVLKARARFARQHLWPDRQDDDALFAGGMAWLPLPTHWNDVDFAREAQSQGIRVAPSRDFETDQVHGEPHIRLSLLAVERDEDFKRAILRLKALIESPYLETVRTP